MGHANTTTRDIFCAPLPSSEPPHSTVPCVAVGFSGALPNLSVLAKLFGEPTQTVHFSASDDFQMACGPIVGADGGIVSKQRIWAEGEWTNRKGVNGQLRVSVATLSTHRGPPCGQTIAAHPPRQCFRCPLWQTR